MALVVLLAILLAVIGLVVVVNARRKRALSALAADLGATYLPDDDPGFSRRFPGIALFAQGQEGVAGDVLSFDAAGRAIDVFAYRYGWRGVRRSIFVHQTVVHVRDPALDLPEFSMRGPDTVRNALERRGTGNVYLPDSPAFSDRHYIAASDPAAVAACFTPAVQALLSSRERVSIDAAGADLFYFRRGEVVKVDDIPGRIRDALSVVEAFAEGTRRPPPLR